MSTKPNLPPASQDTLQVGTPSFEERALRFLRAQPGFDIRSAEQWCHLQSSQLVALLAEFARLNQHYQEQWLLRINEQLAHLKMAQIPVITIPKERA